MKDQIMEYLLSTELEDQAMLSIQGDFSNFLDQITERKDESDCIIVTDESQKDKIQRARELRLEVKEARVAIEKKRKELKEDSLRRGQAIDGVSNMLKSKIEPIEYHLEQQEKFARIQEKKRKDEIRASRLVELEQYNGTDTTVKFEDLNDAEWVVFLQEKIDIYNWKIAEAERLKAEEEEKAKETERLKIENEAIKKENEALKAQQLQPAPAVAQAPVGSNDKTKLLVLLASIKSLNLPVMDTADGSKIMGNVQTVVEKLKTYITEQSSTL